MKNCNYSHKVLREEKFIAYSTLTKTTDVVLNLNAVLEVILLLLNSISQLLQRQRILSYSV